MNLYFKFAIYRFHRIFFIILVLYRLVRLNSFSIMNLEKCQNGGCDHTISDVYSIEVKLGSRALLLVTTHLSKNFFLPVVVNYQINFEKTEQEVWFPFHLRWKNSNSDGSVTKDHRRTHIEQTVQNSVIWPFQHRTDRLTLEKRKYRTSNRISRTFSFI